ncbi:ABC transporter permease [Rhizobium leguminosarum]|uniref:ABC transporter permease n=1 Tax=Rhizobium leguminosarum TaxID=384 RepID=UPI00102F3DAD|nr:ABC transporter permease [Rhizobium leguminosarum]QIO76244.1 ABC transporter permease [Rhizobium leguminosarum bv. trifolii]QIO83263.1 ABC transporter permease [Rhizobium leguminosarum bv. trifolii]TAU16484.1 ABC transporter permease [Rhizobium leguminosarum]TAU34821.1 ABC transporter permease [Rhizobium leguminosarum]TAX43999.1 ABC transporter permease [Rhizobium leguminosarum]
MEEGSQKGSGESAGARNRFSLLARPELTALVGTVVVFSSFAFFTGEAGFLTLPMTRNYLEVGAEIGIIAAPVTLLLVAGEFDLSVGANVALSQSILGYLMVYNGWPFAGAFLAALVIASAVGAVNGILVVKTKLPSFIITLATLFILRGIAQGGLRMLVGTTTIDGVRDHASAPGLSFLFSASVGPFSVSLLWWFFTAILAAWVLEKTAFGNWVFATGGDQRAAVQLGIPVGVVKVSLYIAVAVSTVIVAALDIFAINQSDANAAIGREFEVVTAAVIGGALLTGGYGSPIGSLLGALLFGMVEQGFFFTPLPDVWFMTFLGVVLLLAVLVNNYTRLQALKPRRSGDTRRTIP